MSDNRTPPAVLAPPAVQAKALQALHDGVAEGGVRHLQIILQPGVLEQLLRAGPQLLVALQARLHKVPGGACTH